MDLLSNSFFVTFFIAVQTILLLSWYFKKKQSYWKDRGIPYIKRNLFVELWEDRFQNLTIHEVARKQYSSMPPIYGFFKGGCPTLSVADPHLIKNILVKDFHIFPNRRNCRFGDPLTDNMLFALEDEDWKRIRNILSPGFSPAKFRAQFNTYDSCSKAMIQKFKIHADKGQSVNVKEIFSSFAMDVATTSLFSVKVDSLNNHESALLKLLDNSYKGLQWRFALFNICPGFMKFFKIKFLDPTSNKYFSDITSQLIEERRRKNERRNDFLQLLIDSLEENGNSEQIVNNSEDLSKNCKEEMSNQQKNLDKSSSKKTLNMTEAVAQCSIFFRAGFSTTGLSLAIASYLLALHEDIQNKAREEITKCLEETKGDLTYDALKSMKYIDSIISEVLRLYPLTYATERRVNTEYKLGDTGITLEKGSIVSIPIYGLHHDAKYFPNPDKFDPDRFTVEEKAKRDPYVYLPFGMGPRNCIGMRITQMQLKLGLVYTIRCFKIKTCQLTQIPLKFKKGMEFMVLKNIFLMLEPTDECEPVLTGM